MSERKSSLLRKPKKNRNARSRQKRRQEAEKNQRIKDQQTILDQQREEESRFAYGATWRAYVVISYPVLIQYVPIPLAKLILEYNSWPEIYSREMYTLPDDDSGLKCAYSTGRCFRCCKHVELSGWVSVYVSDSFRKSIPGIRNDPIMAAAQVICGLCQSFVIDDENVSKHIEEAKFVMERLPSWGFHLPILVSKEGRPVIEDSKNWNNLQWEIVGDKVVASNDITKLRFCGIDSKCWLFPLSIFTTNFGTIYHPNLWSLLK